MTKGPQGQKRKADVVGNAVLIGRIAIGEVEDNPTPTAAERGKKGGAARSASLSRERRSEIAREAAEKRWRKEG